MAGATGARAPHRCRNVLGNLPIPPPPRRFDVAAELSTRMGKPGARRVVAELVVAELVVPELFRRLLQICLRKQSMSVPADAEPNKCKLKAGHRKSG